MRRLLHVGPGGEVRIGNQGCTLRRCGAVISGVRQVAQAINKNEGIDNIPFLNMGTGADGNQI